MKDFNTPILFLIFNRPDTTQKVFNEIRKIRPAKFFVAADGPRKTKEGEDEKCRLTREIIKQIDWKCDVKTLFRDENLGCKKAVSSAIDWFFENVEEGIVLEDDCLPDASFFPYCEQLLEKYRNDSRIGMIGGINFQFGHKRGNYSYYFSRYTHIWGWASWRRAWKYYDVNMSIWPEIRDNDMLSNIFRGKKHVDYWKTYLEDTYSGKINTWDYQWAFTCWVNNFLIILPNVNLVSNIGFGTESTHTPAANKFANIPTGSMKFPLAHPGYFIPDIKADRFTEKNNFELPGLFEISVHNFKTFIKKILKIERKK
ncbi:MAG TPA: glycosyltransferase family 2 protein [Candidatus Wallbacteria bacterium]|nr:glycosyltransferase family 2 protein [Candidatus Wallbacteria bacterium]